ncbi:MAG: M48 family metallopeptidase [Clostridia bacterium]
MLGFAPEEYEIAKMKTLGTCKERKITINPEIVKYNRVIDYVVLHQYCHLKYKTHSKNFSKCLKNTNLIIKM